MPSRTPQAAAPDQGAAARGEADDKPKTVDFRGVELTLPPELPGALIFDLADLETNESLAPIIGVLTSMLGEDQVRQVKGKIRDDGITMSEVVDVLSGLIDSILQAYGMSPGESEASPDS